MLHWRYAALEGLALWLSEEFVNIRGWGGGCDRPCNSPILAMQ